MGIVIGEIVMPLLELSFLGHIDVGTEIVVFVQCDGGYGNAVQCMIGVFVLIPDVSAKAVIPQELFPKVFEKIRFIFGRFEHGVVVADELMGCVSGEFNKCIVNVLYDTVFIGYTQSSWNVEENVFEKSFLRIKKGTKRLNAKKIT